MNIAALVPSSDKLKLSAFNWKLLVAAVVAGRADWLFYGSLPGISLVIFILVLAVGIAVVHASCHTLAQNIKMVLLLLIALLPAFEELNMLSLTFALSGAILYSLLMSGTLSSLSAFSMQPVWDLLTTGPFRLPFDYMRERRKTRWVPIMSAGLPGFKKVRVPDIRSWIVPISFGSVFVLLFMVANPIIEDVVTGLFRFFSWWGSGKDVFGHILFSAIFLFITWGMLQTYRKVLPRTKFASPASLDKPGLESSLFDTPTIFRSLALFNIIFGFNTIADVIYLWVGAELPNGLSYAQYAYRGTYALMAAAVIAALFVLATMRPGGVAVRSPMIRRLVYLWVAQTILMIISTIYRLDLYVSVYLMTYSRLAGFIWTGLVGVGLVLIIVQIARERSNSWLVRANVMAMVAMLYLCSLPNFDYIIAKYNVEHSHQVSGKGRSLDWHYMKKLGPQAFPAMLDHYDELSTGNYRMDSIWPWMLQQGMGIVRQREDWRSWGYRSHRLKSWFASQQEPIWKGRAS